MNDAEWREVERDLRDSKNVDRRVAAATKLNGAASSSDVPRLMALLKDEDFFVREAAAWPISELVGSAALPELLAAYQRGFDQGHDNDGFTTALIELAEANKVVAKEALDRLVGADDPALKKNAEWLLEFVQE